MERLPPSWASFDSQFVALESALQLLRCRLKRPVFSEVRKVVQSQISKDFTLAHLCRLMAIMPMAYRLTWLPASSAAAVSLPEEQAILVEVASAPVGKAASAASLSPKRVQLAAPAKIDLKRRRQEFTAHLQTCLEKEKKVRGEQGAIMFVAATSAKDIAGWQLGEVSFICICVCRCVHVRVCCWTNDSYLPIACLPR